MLIQRPPFKIWGKGDMLLDMGVQMIFKAIPKGDWPEVKRPSMGKSSRMNLMIKVRKRNRVMPPWMQYFFSPGVKDSGSAK